MSSPAGSAPGVATGRMTLYQKLPFDANGNNVGLVLQGSNGSADLVAIYNMTSLSYSKVYGMEGPVKEAHLKSIISDMLDACFGQVEDISDAQKAEIKHVLSNIRTHFSLQPRLSGHMDFVNNASYLLCRVLKLPVLHGWVLDPEAPNYDSLNTFSHEELLKHTSTLDQRDQVGLLDGSQNQLTPYGIGSLPAELCDQDMALLSCRNRLNIIHKHCGLLFIFVTDELVHKTMPEAVFIPFEDWCEERYIYLTEKYSPVKGQPLEKEARGWYLKFLETVRKQLEEEDRMKQEEEDRRKRQEDEGWRKRQEDEARRKRQEDEARRKRQEDKARRKARVRKVKGESSQQAQSHDGVPKSFESNEGEDKSSNELSQKEASRSHNSGDQDDNRSLPDKAKTEVDNVPQGVASEFLSFLTNFKDDVCSEPYFKGIVAAFTSHRPLFYVPYDFIVAHDEQLALNIQDNYTRISEDLKESVVFYLSKNGVDFPDAELTIIGLPEPKRLASSAWRHYTGSDYMDKSNGKLEDATTGDMMHDLLASISDKEVTPYVQAEVSARDSLYQSVLICNADLTDLQTKLNEKNFKFELAEDHLCWGSISIRERHYPATEESDGHTAIVVEGPFSVEYDSVYLFLVKWVFEQGGSRG